MGYIPIRFFTEDVTFIIKQKKLIKNWINQTLISEGHQLQELNYIFCSDAFLLSLNLKYLNHNTLTDIITFDNSDNELKIAGDIFISIERVKENAIKYRVTMQEEMHRVMIHGALHLSGFKDKLETEKKIMTQKEDFYLEKLKVNKMLNNSFPFGYS